MPEELPKYFKEYLDSQFDGLSQKLDNIKSSHERRITALEDNNKWIFRLVVGTIITGIIGTYTLLK